MSKSKNQRIGRRKHNPKKPSKAASINTTEDFERALIERAQGGDDDAGTKSNHPKSLNKDEVLYRSHRYNF